MNKINICRCLKVLGFLCLVLICFYRFFRVFGWKDATGGDAKEDTVNHFYEMEKDTVDVMFYGSSHCYCTVNQAVLWKNTGIAGFNFATGCSHLGNTYYYMKESLKTQHPRVMAVEVFYATDAEYGNVGNVYRNVLSMDWSKEYVDNVVYTKHSSEVPVASSAEMLLKVPIIHTRYKDLSKQDFVDNRFYGRGNYITWKVAEGVGTPKACNVDEVGELSEETLYWLDKIVELADNEKIELVFWVSPYLIREDEAKIFNAVEVYSRTKGIEFINFNRIYKKIDFDYSTDMTNRGHLNVSGSNKVTAYLGVYLQDKYNLPSHRGEKQYYLWELNAEAWEHEVNNHKMQEIQNLEEFLCAVPTEGYSVVVMSAEENIEWLYGSYGGYQISPDNSYQGIWLWVDGRKQASDKECLELDLNEYTAMTVRDGVVNIVGQKFYVPQKGVRVIVFDNLLDEWVDNVFCSDMRQIIER